MNLSERDKQVIWHPYTQQKTAELPIPIVRGEGAYLFDEKGNKYIDAVSSWWTNIHGHAHPYIAEKVFQQLKTLEHVMFAGFTHPTAVELAERLLKILPVNQSKIFYSDNGSTAVEVALKMAFQYWHNQKVEKKKVIAFKNAYHGDTFGAMSVSGRSAFTKPFDPFLFDVIFIDAPIKGKEEESIQQMKFQISNPPDGRASLTSQISSFIFEPLIQGTAGMIMYEAEPLNELMKICKENNILTIADEVMTGFGRTGKYFATNNLSEQPDIICLSKGITGGTMALGVTSCSEKIYNAFLFDEKIPLSQGRGVRGEVKTFFHGHSYAANPIACSAALASLDLLEKKECWENINRIELQHKDFVNKLRTLNLPTKDIRSLGTILAIEINTGEETSYFNDIKNTANKFFLERGIILRPLGNILYIMPPYCISNEDLKFIYDGIVEFLNIPVRD